MAWYNASWSYRKSVTVDYTKLTADVSNFPVFIKLDDLGANFWSAVKNGGGDIRITKSDGTTELAREIVICNTSTSKGELHFKADSVSTSTNTVFYIYYGNSGASDYAATDTYGRNNVWDSNYKAVWHFPDGTTLTSNDSTSNGNDLTQAGSPTASAGQMDGGASTAGSSYMYRTSAPVTVAPITVSSWVKPTDVTNNGGIVCIGQFGAGNQRWQFELASGNIEWGAITTEGGGVARKSGATTGSWQYFVGVENASNSRVAYRNAVAGSVDTTNRSPASVDRVSVMSLMFTGGYHVKLPTADVDEVRISNVARSSHWITAEYNNQNSPSTFYALGSQESGGTVVIITNSRSILRGVCHGIMRGMY